MNQVILCFHARQVPPPLLEEGEMVSHPPRPSGSGRLGEIGGVQGHNSLAYVQIVFTKPEIRTPDSSIVCQAR